MIVRLENLPPMPRNQENTLSRGRIIKTEKGRQFKKAVPRRFEHYLEERVEFMKDYDPKTEILAVTLIVESPVDLLITKAGTVSKSSVDWDAHKSLWDCFSDFIGVDDSQFMDVRIVKTASDNFLWNFEFRVKRVKRVEVANDLFR